MPERVLITGARAPAALDLARSFAAAGFETHMADCAPCLMARSARAPKHVHRYPSPRLSRAEFSRAISALAAELDPVVVVPACEEVFHLAAIPSLSAKLFAPPMEVLVKLHSKSAFAAACKELGLAAPETWRVADADALEPHLAQSRDLVFKRDFSRFGVRALIGPSVDAVRRIRPAAEDAWVVQRRVLGEEVSFYAASRDSKLAAFCAYRSTWRLGGGAGYAFAPLDPAQAGRLREMADTLAERLVPMGQFACDAIVDGSGQPWLIECNPRATSGTHFFARRAELALAILGRGESCDANDEIARHVGPALWWYGGRSAFFGGRSKEWSEQRMRGHEVITAPGDRAPLLGALADTALFGFGALLHGRSLAAETTADIEWNGEPL